MAFFFFFSSLPAPSSELGAHRKGEHNELAAAQAGVGQWTEARTRVPAQDVPR